jgi:hypothetical protein
MNLKNDLRFTFGYSAFRNLTRLINDASYYLKSRLFSGPSQNFAINDVNCHLRAGFADADGVALLASIHLG